MTHYTAIEAQQWSIGQGANGTGKRVLIKGAFTVDPNGRKVRAFRNSEGGIEAACKWANVLNARMTDYDPRI